MTPEQIFTIANNGILIFWLLLLVAPHWRGTQFAVQSVAIPLLLGLTYIWLIATGFLGAVPPGASFFSLPGVMAFFASPVLATAGWIHYLVFDLFIGAWQVRDSHRRGLAHWMVIPCLLDHTDVRTGGAAVLSGAEAGDGQGRGPARRIRRLNRTGIQRRHKWPYTGGRTMADAADPPLNFSYAGPSDPWLKRFRHPRHRTHDGPALSQIAL